MPSEKPLSSYPVVKVRISRLRPSDEINVQLAQTPTKIITEDNRWTVPISLSTTFIISYCTTLRN